MRLKRFNGHTRYDTNIQSLKYKGTAKLVISSGESFSDSDFAQFLANRLNADFVINRPNSLDWYTEQYLKTLNLKPEDVLLVGGEDVLTPIAEGLIAEALGFAPHTKDYSYIDYIDYRDEWTIENGIPIQKWDDLQHHMNCVQRVTDKLGIIFEIRSGYRSDWFIESGLIDSSLTSQHCFAKASDVYDVTRKVNCYTIARLIHDDAELRGLFKGYGLGSNTNVHLDTRPSPAEWWYRYKSWEDWRKHQ